MGISFFKSLFGTVLRSSVSSLKQLLFLLCRKRLGTALQWIIMNSLMFELFVALFHLLSCSIVCVSAVLIAQN